MEEKHYFYLLKQTICVDKSYAPFILRILFSATVCISTTAIYPLCKVGLYSNIGMTREKLSKCGAPWTVCDLCWQKHLQAKIYSSVRDRRPKNGEEKSVITYQNSESSSKAIHVKNPHLSPD